MLCMRHLPENIISSRFRSRRKTTYILLSEKKKGRLFGVEKNKLHKKIFQVSASVFQWYCDKHETFWAKYTLSTRRWSRMFLDITFTIFWFRVANMLLTIFEQFLFPILVISWSPLIISCSLQAIFKIDFILCGSCFKNFDV